MKNYYKKFLILVIISLFVSACTQTGKKTKGFQHDVPLIKTDVKKLGKKELEKSAEMGPKPVEGDVIKLKKEKNIISKRKKLFNNPWRI